MSISYDASVTGMQLPGASQSRKIPELVFNNPPVPTFAFSELATKVENTNGETIGSVPYKLGDFFPQMYVNYYQPTPLQSGFLSGPNVLWLKNRVEDLLTRATGVPTVVPLDEQFTGMMLQLAQGNPGIPSSPEGLALLNRVFIERQLELQFYSLRHQNLYKRYFIDQVRLRNMPYGDYVGGTQVTVSPSGYMLSHPWRKMQESYLAATANLKPVPPAKAVDPGEFKSSPFMPGERQYCSTGIYGQGWTPTSSGQKHPINTCMGPRTFGIPQYVGNPI